MTTVAACLSRPSGLAFLASDTMAYDGSLKYEFGPKWVVSPCGGRAIGWAGNVRTTCLLRRHHWLWELCVEDLAERIRKTLKDADYQTSASDDDSSAPEYDTDFLYAGPGGLFVIESDFAVVDHTKRGFWAIGSGKEFAIAAMRAGAGVQQAVEIACDMDLYSGRPVWTGRVRMRGEAYAIT